MCPTRRSLHLSVDTPTPNTNFGILILNKSPVTTCENDLIAQKIPYLPTICHITTYLNYVMRSYLE